MRKARKIRKELLPDPVFDDRMVTRFVNCMMRGGQKGKAYRVFYAAMDLVKEKTGESGHEVWKKALDNVMPSVEVRSKRVGGATFQIPAEVHGTRKVALGMKWMIQFARARKGKPMAQRLAEETIAASNAEGGAVKKRQDTHRMAESNRAFSHFKF